MAAGDTAIDGVGGRLALPVNGTELVAPAALCAMVSVEDFAPVVVGRRVRLTLHEAPAASVEPMAVLRPAVQNMGSEVHIRVASWRPKRTTSSPSSQVPSPGRIGGKRTR